MYNIDNVYKAIINNIYMSLGFSIVLIIVLRMYRKWISELLREDCPTK